MELLQELIAIDHTSPQPVYLQISHAMIAGIRQGKLRKGLKLPGTRGLADLLHVNRMTVVAAYQELDAQGWIEMHARQGTFVKAVPPLLAPTGITRQPLPAGFPAAAGFSYDKKRILPIATSNFPSTGKLIFNDGFPDIRLAPIDALGATIRNLSRRTANRKYLQYGGAQGTLPLRETLAEFLCDTRGLAVTPENILITKGAQMGIFVAGSVILKPGDDVIVGTPGYDMADTTFRQLGARLNEVPVDAEGIDTARVERLCKKKKIRLLYVIPHHHNPTTVTLSPERRMHLLHLAAMYKFAILEDDYDYDFHYASRPIMPMVSHDSRGHVIYVGTLTKTFAPSVRFGFVVAPADFIQTATYFRKMVDTQGDSFMEHAIAELYRDGTLTRHIKKSVKLYRERRDHFCDLLQTELRDHIDFTVPDGGMSVWARFHADLKKVSARALEKGLVIKDGTSYDTDKIKYNAVRLGFASLNLKEQEQAVGILKAVLRDEAVRG
ncbi:MocR-like pyridoxine biosynthesis transcription factor PdxR [Dawidia soli]|uniref:PLP-dependent aminotransferase family protein n=1 Tax=Dawidia soli TaxID=2782352 RepID=A0AAP2DGB0_9BACT|nr:PLP-dependent aminotransferase family protein [Dawidia soli]MBT1690767.1 PLP-dependent aminotransferase family protein [Dawidia soli]